MEHECCDTCEHQFSVDPCNQCDFDGEELGSHDEGKNTRVSHWEPDFHSRSLIAFGRRAGIEEAAKALDTRALAIGTSLLHAGFYATSAEFVRALLEGK